MGYKVALAAGVEGGAAAPSVRLGREFCVIVQSMNFHRSSHSVWDCRYHIVWCTWRRKKALTESHERAYCEELLRRVASEYGMEIVAVEVDEDHVHLSIDIPPQQPVSKAVACLKSVSARLVFKRFSYLKKKLWAGRLWGASYFVRSIGQGVTAEMVKRYIENHDEKSDLGPIQGELFP